MKQFLAMLGMFLALAIVANAADEPKEINLTGTLRVTSVKNSSGKSSLRVYLEDDKGQKTQILLNLTDKTQTPKVKPLSDKKVEIVGKGTTKMRGKVGTITLTTIEKFAEVAAKPPVTE